MNAALHDIANPPSPEKAELEIGQRTFRVGDKVMQMKTGILPVMVISDISEPSSGMQTVFW